jgi:hypothetical protein
MSICPVGKKLKSTKGTNVEQKGSDAKQSRPTVLAVLFSTARICCDSEIPLYVFLAWLLLLQGT